MDDKMTGHVSALQLLLGDWDKYSIRRAVNLAFPDTFHIIVNGDLSTATALTHIKEAYRIAGETANFVESLKLGPSNTKDLLLDLANTRSHLGGAARALGITITP